MAAPGGVELLEPIWSWASSSLALCIMAWRSRSAAVVELAPPAVVIAVGSQWVGSRRCEEWCEVAVESVGTALDDLERIERRGRGRAAESEARAASPGRAGRASAASRVSWAGGGLRMVARVKLEKFRLPEDGGNEDDGGHAAAGSLRASVIIIKAHAWARCPKQAGLR